MSLSVMIGLKLRRRKHILACLHYNQGPAIPRAKHEFSLWAGGATINPELPNDTKKWFVDMYMQRQRRPKTYSYTRSK